MDIIKSYGNLIKKQINNPKLSRNLIKAGLSLEGVRVSKFKDKTRQSSYGYLNEISLKFMLEPLKNPQKSVFVNLFAPCEILQVFDMYPVLVEAYSSFMSGLMCEEGFIDSALNIGISENLCSYHKTFAGAIEKGVLEKPKCAITTTTACDANVGTFKFIEKKYKVPTLIIDVPYDYSKDNLLYVKKQLQELITLLTKVTGKAFDIDKLREIIKRENQVTAYRLEFLNLLKTHDFDRTLTLEMYTLFTSHPFIGREETLQFYKMLKEDIEKSPKREKLHVLWVHLMPFYHKTLKEYFNYNENYEIACMDMNYDYLGELSEEDPLLGIAEKLILNQFNGPFKRKIENINKIIELSNPDSVIQFSHMGCRQSSGGIMLLKNALKEANLPFLVLDGDGVDRRLSSEGQIKTRLEAYFEMIKEQQA